MDEKKPHYHNHRTRMKEKSMKPGLGMQYISQPDNR